MQDYEITEIKLAVAKEEGHATQGFGSSIPDLAIESIVSGLGVILIPHEKGALRVVVITDPLDLSLIGLGEKPLIVLHDSDIEALDLEHIPPNRVLFERRPALSQWWFYPIVLAEADQIKRELMRIFPGLRV